MKLTVRYRGLADMPVIAILAADSRGRVFDAGWRERGLRRIDEQIGAVLDAVRNWPEFAAQARLQEAGISLLEDEFPAMRW